MLIADHINLIGDNPLVGDNIDAWGPRFPDLSQVYEARETTENSPAPGHRTTSGYRGAKGPQPETRPRPASRLGADW
jgi:purine-nucleoside phosphorylase